MVITGLQAVKNLLVITGMFAASAQPYTPLTSAPRLQTPGVGPLHPSEAIYSQAARTWPCTIDPYRFQAYLEGYESRKKQFV